MKVVLIAGFLVVLVASGIFLLSKGISRRIKGTPDDLGQQLLIAAEKRQWHRAEILLDSGAYPRMTQLDRAHEEMRDPRDWRDWLGMRVRYTSGHPFTLPTALDQAMQQGNSSAVKMLLDHHAPVDDSDIYHATQFGNREVIQLMEDYGKVPLKQRSIAPFPFAPGGAKASIRGIRNTMGAVPTRHLLWISPHELLLVRDNPRRFSILNLDSENESEFPELSKKWIDEGNFNPDMLALSPDGQWLLGVGGTPDHPTWLATRLHGEGRQEWDRELHAVPAKKFTFQRASQPMIAWRDGTRWIEITGRSKSRIAVQRTLGQADISELPIDDGSDISFSLPYPIVLFNFATPDRGLISGVIGESGHETTALRFEVVAGLDSWHMENREIRLDEVTYPRQFERFAPSPDGKSVAWLVNFRGSEACNLLLSDADGKNFRIVYEKLSPSHDREKNRTANPCDRSLEWTPDGKSLIFWRGDHGEGGLGRLDLSSGWFW